jgi:hypothetical protein
VETQRVLLFDVRACLLLQLSGWKLNVAFGKSKTVLVVGKQPKEIAYLTKHLSVAGYEILLARTGARAIKVTKEHAPRRRTPRDRFV